MKWVKASEFKADCVELLGNATAVAVVKRGVLAGVCAPPLPAKRFRLGENLGGLRITGDIVSPMNDLWEDSNQKFDRINRRRS